MRTTATVIGLGFLVMGIAFASGAPEADSPAAREFVIGNGAAPTALDPHQISSPREHRIVMGLFEGLVAPDPETSRATPGLAEWWEITDDGLEYTFFLRQGAVWSDGTGITAHDVVDSWLRVLNPRTAAPSAWLPAQFIKGAQEFHLGEAGAEAVAIRAVDDYTFQFEAVQPTPYLLDLLSHYAFQVVPLHIIDEQGDQWTRPENFVGNGPYTLTEWDSQGRVVLQRNDSYWNAPSVRLDRVVFAPIENDIEAFDQYADGEFDWLPAVSSEHQGEARQRDDYHVSPDLQTTLYLMNTEREPLDDPDVRRALSAVIDRQRMVETVTGAGEIPAYALVPPISGYPGIEGIQEDVATARQLLADAGYPGGAGFPSLTVRHPASEDHQAVAEFVQSQWRDNLGIEVRLESLPRVSFASQIQQGDFDIAPAGWIGAFQDPAAFLDLFVTGGELNHGRFRSERYTLRVAEAARMDSDDNRFSTLQEAERILIEGQTGVIPLYHHANRNLIDLSEWGGWYANVMNVHPVGDIYEY
ncbi:MAG: peptide ABC transporter substrate-binding protein [Alkalispirochaeta sp.]